MLPNTYVIHCLGPVYGRDVPSDSLLADCYRNALRLADESGVESVAFPAISTGIFGYPLSEAASVALRAVAEVAPSLRNVRLVRFVLRPGEALRVHEAALAALSGVDMEPDPILTRRSIRRYTEQPVPEEMVTGLLQAAMAAPSARNQQPWHFVVIRERDTLEKIAAMQSTARMARHAPLTIVVCGDLDLDNDSGYWVQDCAAATENILLWAHAHGLGAVWCGIYPREHRVSNYRALLGLPDRVVPLALVVVGYPAEELPPSDRFKPDRVHNGRW
jgi:nitroreductase